MALSERIVAVIGFGGAGKRFAEAARLALVVAEREQIRQAKELEAFQQFYNLSDEYVAKMQQASAELGISMREVMDRIERASVYMRQAGEVVRETMEPLANMISEIYRGLEDPGDDRRIRWREDQRLVQAKIRPYKL
jgi:D-arabinose 1-dehydrogenase-like Zn-dependent alcohol dehydrogenase